MNYFVADCHLGHDNIRKYCHRPFASVEEMDETIITNWNACVKSNDTVYSLGDLSFHPENYINKLNGKKCIILGNHDCKRHRYVHDSILWVDTLKTVSINGFPIVLCHYPLAIWDRCHYDAWHMYGHTHVMRDATVGKSLNVGVDLHDFKPWSFDEIEATMDTKPHHPSYIAIHEAEPRTD